MRAFSSAVLAVAAGLLGACERFEPLVVCHNANCATPDVDRDDTLPALRESLALTHDGLPALDGMELDTFWYGAGSQCLFAHDLDNGTSVPILDAADVVKDFLATHQRASWRGDRFYLFLEFKPNVGPKYTDAHSEEQLVDHVECMFDVAERVLEGARSGGHEITFAFISSVPHAFDVMTTQPRWSSLSAEPDVELMLVGDIFAPYSSLVPELRDFKHLDAAEYHPDFMTEPQRETYRSLDIDLVQWSFVTTTEALDAIEHWEPRFAITNEAALVRNWTQN